MKIFKRILLVILILFMLLFAALFFLIYTQSGLKVITAAVEKFVPALKIDQAEGNLRNLSLLGIHYQDQGIDVKADKANLAISGSCLLSSHVCIKKLMLENANIVVNTALLPQSPSKESAPITEIRTPVPLVLDNLRLKNIHVDVDDMQFNLDELTTAARWTSRQVTLKPSQINGLQIILPEKAAETASTQDVKTTSTQPLGETLEALFSKPLLEKLPLESLPISVDIQGITGKNWLFKLPQEIAVHDFALKGKMDAKSVTINTLNIVNDDANIMISGNTQLVKKWPVKLDINATLFPEQTQQDEVSLALTGNALDTLKLDVKSNGLINGNIALNTQLSNKALPTTLKLNVKEIKWPLFDAKPDYILNDIIIGLNGNLRDYALNANAALESKIVPVKRVTLNGKGNLTQFNLRELFVNALDGNATLTGSVNWAKAIKWNAALNTDSLKLANYLPDYPAILSGKMETKGHFVSAQDWALDVNDLAVTGKMDKHKIDIIGDVSGDAKGNWDIKTLHAIWGDNTLTASGKASTNGPLDINAVLRANNFSQLLPDLKGNASGNIVIKGTYKKPIADIDLAINQLKWQDWALQSAKLNGNVTSDKEIAGDLKLDLKGINGAGVDYKHVLVDLKGSMSSHQLTLNADGLPIKTQLTLNGHFDDKQNVWNGALQQAKITQQKLGDITLNKAAKIRYSLRDNAVEIGDHCWLRKEASVCVPKTFKVAPNGGGEIVIHKFDLRTLNMFLHESGLRLQGELNGSINAKWGKTLGVPDADLSISGENITVAQEVGIQILPLHFDKIALNGKLNSNALTLDLLTKLKNNGDISSNLRITDLNQSRKLAGKFVIDHISFDVLKPLLQKNDIAKGDISGDLTFGGTLLDPNVRGNIAISDLNLLGEWLPTEIQSGSVNLKFNGKQSTLNGKLKSKDGALDLTGRADWSKMEDWFAEISAKGQQLAITVPPMISMKISPDLSVKVNSKALNISGKVVIPWARITVEGVPEGAVDVSADEVMLDEHLQPIQTKTGNMVINGNIALNFGDDIELNAFGLVAKLKGGVLVRQEKQNLGLHGTIRIPEGRFHAYGQDLLIKKGELVFAGPVDQPRLNIEAIRNPESIEDNVTAGIRVTGLADEPKMELFSEPSMSQQEILSYLLSGQGLSSSGNSNNDTITALLIGLGASQGGKYIGKLGEAFGIKNLGIDTQGVGDSSQVVVSGNLTKDLQIKYGIGIFDALATITMRYRLMPKLYLEAVSSIDQTIDLIYQFEF